MSFFGPHEVPPLRGDTRYFPLRIQLKEITLEIQSENTMFASRSTVVLCLISLISGFENTPIEHESGSNSSPQSEYHYPGEVLPS